MKKILFRISALLIGVGFVLISLELFLRLNPKFGYVYQSFRLAGENETKARWFNSPRYSLRPSALLWYEHIPNTLNGKINAYGLVGREYKLEKDKGVWRILVLGDSIAEQGWSCEFLEDQLNNNLLHAKYKFEIWNAGLGGYDVQRYYRYLKYRGLRYNPDTVIIFLFMNDFEICTTIYYKTQDGAIAYYFDINEISKYYIVNPFLLRHSYLYRFIILRLESYLLGKKKQQGINLKEEYGRYYLQMIKDICEERGLPLFVVIFPYLEPLDEYREYQIMEYQTICKVTKELKMNYLNLYEYLPTKDLCGMREDKEDEVHPNQEGHRIIAKIIYDYLLKKTDMHFLNKSEIASMGGSNR